MREELNKALLEAIREIVLEVLEEREADARREEYERRVESFERWNGGWD